MPCPAYTQTLHEKSKKCPNETVLHYGDSFEAVAHTQLRTSRNDSPLAEQSFGVSNIHIHRIVFELCVEKKKERKRNKIEIFMFAFLDLVKGLQNL